MSELSVLPLLDQARLVVLGVVTARQNDSIGDAHLLISTYLAEAEESGYRLTQAWSQLFAAATLLIVGLVECRSKHHDMPVDQVVQELGLALAEYQANV